MAKREFGLSVSANRNAGPIVRAERRSGQPCPIIKITHGIIGPGVAHCQRTRDVFVPDDNGVTFDAGLGPNEFVIRSSNCEAFQWPTIGGFQSATKVRELDTNLVLFDGE